VDSGLQRMIYDRTHEAWDVAGPFSCEFEVLPDNRYFPSPRDYAFCQYNPDTGHIRIGLAPKFLSASRSRQDALIRHELGHAIDFIVPPPVLDEYAANANVVLSITPERRADDIAYLVWGVPLRYDMDLVQHLSQGNYPRPAHLGL
jgi:hypothetical protein